MVDINCTPQELAELIREMQSGTAVSVDILPKQVRFTLVATIRWWQGRPDKDRIPKMCDELFDEFPPLDDKELDMWSKRLLKGELK